VKALRELGWQFYPTGPNEWEWLKFDISGRLIGCQGDEIWKQDMLRIKRGLEE
jgi:hypothetical protein